MYIYWQFGTDSIYDYYSKSHRYAINAAQFAKHCDSLLQSEIFFLRKQEWMGRRKMEERNYIIISHTHRHIHTWTSFWGSNSELKTRNGSKRNKKKKNQRKNCVYNIASSLNAANDHKSQVERGTAQRTHTHTYRPTTLPDIWLVSRAHMRRENVSFYTAYTSTYMPVLVARMMMHIACTHTNREPNRNWSENSCGP